MHGQRRSYIKNKLSNKRIDLLEAAGFVWYPMTNDWQNMYDQLVEFKEQVSLGAYTSFIYDDLILIFCFICNPTAWALQRSICKS